MKKIVQKIVYSQFFSGSLIMVVGSNGASFLNYIYHLLMGRLLGPTNYGELSALLSLISLLGVIPGAFGPVIVKFVSSAKNEKETASLISWFSRRVIVLGIVMAILTALFSPFLANFLKISDFRLILLTGAVFIFSLGSMFNRSALQGLLKFPQMIATVLFENFTKLLLGLLLVYLGYSVFGAVVGFVLATFVGWYYSKNYISEYLKNKTERFQQLEPMAKYAFFIIFQSISTTSLYSVDLILVKHFFPPYQAGIYAALSTLGKIIFFATGPISTVMFATISKKHSSGERFKQVFGYSFGLIILASAIILAIYNFFPTTVIGLLYGSKYFSAAGLLTWFGFFMCIYTLSSLIINYYLSIGKTKVVILPVLAAIAQVGGIWVYHHSLQEVIIVSILATGALLTLLCFSFFSSEILDGYKSKLKF